MSAQAKQGAREPDGYTRQEMMAIATGREIRDREIAIFGVGLSMLAGFFAQAHHAPGVRAMTEGGVYGSSPVGGLPWGIECNRISTNATSFTSALDALGCLVGSGRCDVGIVGAAQVDKFGNVNTTGIWDGDIGETFRAPKTRLTGAGGANDIACGAKRYLIMVAHEPKRFAEKVTYISSPGYLEGGNARERHGFVGGGPSAIVTTLGVLRPHADTKEFELDGWYEFSGPEEIIAATGWDLKVRHGAGVIPPPSASEIEALRRVDETGALRKK
jgi:glutaconate CoA-transferase subunit B